MYLQESLLIMMLYLENMSMLIRVLLSWLVQRLILFQK